MKEFKFTMQKVLEYKNHLEDREKTVLWQMRSHYEKMHQEFEEIKKEYDIFLDKYNEIYRRGITAKEMVITKTYMSEFADRIYRMLLEIKDFETEIDLQINKLVAISQDKNTMEKLKARQFVIYREKQRKELELFIDDFVVNMKHFAASQLS